MDDVDEEFAAEFAQRFADVWRMPDLDKHESIWSDDIVLIQPLSGTMRGKDVCRAGFERIFSFIPDRKADVHSFGHGDSSSSSP